MKTRFPACCITAVLAALTWVTFTALAWARFPQPFSPLSYPLSDLGHRVDNPQGAVFYNSGLILTAFFLALWFLGLSQFKNLHPEQARRWRSLAQLCGLLAAFAVEMSALYPLDQPQAYSLWVGLQNLLFAGAFAASVAALRYHPQVSRLVLLLGALAAALSLLALLFPHLPWLEWLAMILVLAYPLALGLQSLSFRRLPSGASVRPPVPR